MLIRDNRYHAVTSQQWDVNPATSHLAARQKGSLKWLSAKNDEGYFKPGTFRANPVVIGSAECTLSTVTSGAGTTKIGNTPYAWNYDGELAAYLAYGSGQHTLTMPALVWDSMLADGSITKAYAKVAAPEFDLGVTLGELRETFEGLANPVSGLRKYVTQFKKLRSITIKEWQKRKHVMLALKGTSQHLTMLGSSWLEWRMAVRPLLKSIEDLIEHLEAQSRVLEGKLVRCKSSVKREASLDPINISVGPGSIQLFGTTNTVIETQTTTGIYYYQKIPLSFGQKYGIDWTSVPAVTWELVRLSFVVDRFLRIGEYLQSLRVLWDDSRTIAGTVTTQKTTQTQQTILNYVTVQNIPASARAFGSVYETRSMWIDRRVNLALPVLPAVNFNPLKWQQQLDHLALLWQSLPKVNWYEQIRFAYQLDAEIMRAENPKRPYVDRVNWKFNKKRR